MARRLPIAAQLARPRPKYPATHVPALVIPEEGARCSTCIYLGERDGLPACKSSYYVKWAGTDRLVEPYTGRIISPERFCSDWYDPG